MFATPHRQKGGGPQLGAAGPGEDGPFGPYGGEDDGQGDGGSGLTRELIVYSGEVLLL